MGKDIMDTVVEKEFYQLSPQEREELSDMCSTEEEFNQLKFALQQTSVLVEEKIQPSKDVKDKLDHLFLETYPKKPVIWYNSMFAVVVPKDKPFYRQPLIQVAAIALIAFITVPFLFNDSGAKNKPIVAKVEKTETSIGKKDAVDSEQDIIADIVGTDDVEHEIVADYNASEDMGSDESEPEVLIELTALSEPETMTSIASNIDTDHPDGVFGGELDVVSMPVSEELPDVLDLLTTTF